jgi:hypothetical protein
MNTDAKGFKEAFFKVLPKQSGDYYGPLRNLRGSMYSKSFSIHKHREEARDLRLDGEIIEDENGLLLELYLPTDYDDTIRLGLKMLVFSWLLAYGIAYLLFVLPGIEEYFLIGEITLTILIFPFLFMLGRWMTKVAVNGLQHDFTGLLKEVEKQIPIPG